MSWQVQEARQRFSELIRRAEEDGPQTVARHGKDVVVVVGVEEYTRLQHEANVRFVDFLRSMPELPDELLDRQRRSRLRLRRVLISQL